VAVSGSLDAETGEASESVRCDLRFFQGLRPRDAFTSILGEFSGEERVTKKRRSVGPLG
jgi:hypothetical protein